MALSKLFFDDLPDDMIIEIFSRLPVNKLLSTERVSRSWMRLVDKTLNRVEVFAFGKPFEWKYDANRCPHLRQPDSTKTLVFVNKKINLVKVNSMIRLLTRCDEIKCLTLDANIQFNDIDVLRKLVNALPQLECLYCASFMCSDKFYYQKWQLICQVIGPKLKHLTIEGPCKRKKNVDMLITNSTKLETLYLTKMFTTTNSWFNNPEDQHLIDVTFEFSGQTKQIQLTCFLSMVRHFRKDGRIKNLAYVYAKYDGPIDKLQIKFPAVEYLVLDQFLDPVKALNDLAVYNLATIKTLKMSANEELLTILAGKMTSLEKLILESSSDQFVTDSLLLLQSLRDLQLSHSIRRGDQLSNILKLLKVLAELKQLKQCRVSILTHCCFHHLNPNVMPKDLESQLIQAEADLCESLPFAEINFPLISQDNFTATRKQPYYSSHSR